jgi:hypothetical protein
MKYTVDINQYKGPTYSVKVLQDGSAEDKETGLPASKVLATLGQVSLLPSRLVRLLAATALNDIGAQELTHVASVLDPERRQLLQILLQCNLAGIHLGGCMVAEQALVR